MNRILLLVAFAAIAWWVALVVLSGLGRRLHLRPWAKFGWVFLLLLACLVPIGGASLWQAAFGLWTNPSVPLLAWVGAALAQRVFGQPGLSPPDRRALWQFGAVAGTALYLHTFFFDALDLYYWGWVRSVAVPGVAALAVIFLARGSRLGIVFLAALVAFLAGVLESANCWDYLVDPVYWLISLGVLTREFIGKKMASRPVPSAKVVA